jgi:hypothetical protein
LIQIRDGREEASQKLEFRIEAHKVGSHFKHPQMEMGYGGVTAAGDEDEGLLGGIVLVEPEPVLRKRVVLSSGRRSRLQLRIGSHGQVNPWGWSRGARGLGLCADLRFAKWLTGDGDDAILRTGNS